MYMSVENSYPTTEKWQKNFDTSKKEHPEDTVFHKTELTRQEEDFSCGAATLTSVINTVMKKSILEEEIITNARNRIHEKGGNIEEWGIPPDIMEIILSSYGVYIEIKPSDKTYDNEETLINAQEWLDSRLLSGHICITPIQITPEYWFKDNVSGELVRETEKEEGREYTPVYTSDKVWTDSSKPPIEVPEGSPGRKRATTRKDVDYNGHYVLVVGKMHRGETPYYITVDPMYKWYQEESPTIDPKYTGIRFIPEKLFIKSWHDKSGRGEPYNQYAISVKVPNEDANTDELLSLAKELISKSNVMEIPWRSAPNEPYGIRRFNRNNSEETQIFTDIYRHPKAMRWLYSSENPEKINEDMDWMLNIDETDKEDPRILWAIVDKENKPVGWVMFYKDNYLPDNLKNKLGVDTNSLILEVSYVKSFTDWPEGTQFIHSRDNLTNLQNEDVVINGLRQSLLLLKSREKIISTTSATTPRQVVITAYTDPENVASEKVLIANEFEKQGKVDYEGEQNNIWVKNIQKDSGE